MCTKTIVEASAGTAGFLVGGPAGAAAAAGTVRAIQGKPLIGGDILPRASKPVLPPPPEDLVGRKRREAARATKRTLAGRPGAGRRATQITTPGSGAGPAGLKTRTGQ